MTAFFPGKPVDSRLSQITVDGTLAPGRHLFRLVVTDDAGNRSAAAEAVVAVVDDGRVPPDRIVTPVDRGPVVRPTEPTFTTVSPAPPVVDPARQPASPPVRPSGPAIRPR